MIRRILDWLWHIQGLTCREAIHLSARALDTPLPVGERVKLLMHRLLCSYCRNYARQLRLLRRWARRMGEPNVESAAIDMPPASAARIKKRLESEIPWIK
jgi:hypothetical protein